MVAADKKKCFVVMGFGTKTDFQQQKAYDLDKTYRIIIKKAVEEAGLECIRADDVVHSGIIDKPMYELLLEADLVVADLSTSNANAIYELGVRHALRPYTTIVIAEKNFKFPFDINHLVIRPYKHLGEGIDAEDAELARDSIKKAIAELIDKQQSDSPVYEFLPSLQPPIRSNESLGFEEMKTALRSNDGQTVSLLMDMFQQARAAGNWQTAQSVLERLADKLPGDAFVIQQFALATYKSEKPDAKIAFHKARYVLSALDPKRSNDPETLGIWGAIHKRLWYEEGKLDDLNEAIRSYEKGFYLKDDHYNGINYAFMLNVRASVAESKSEQTADYVWAERVRRRVIALVEERLANFDKQERDGKRLCKEDRSKKFWLKATLIEALVGTGQTKRAESEQETAIAEAPEPWMPKSLEDQLAKLENLLDEPAVNTSS